MKIADMHCDTISKLWEAHRAGSQQELFCNSLHIDIQRMKEAGYILQNFALYVDLEKNRDPFTVVMELADLFDQEMEKNKSDIGVVKSFADIARNMDQQRLSALMTVEEGGCCKGEIANLERLYNRGVRMMTLTWNYPNELAFPNVQYKEKDNRGFSLFDNTKGLTKKGFAFIERMEEMGMIIDVSHLSDAGFWDVAAHTRRSFVASHSNARSLCGHARNLTDEMIRAVADRGGIIGLNFYGAFLNQEYGGLASVERMAAHVCHIVNVGGIECLGLGSDFDGIDGMFEIADCSQVSKLVQELERQQFSAQQIEQIFYRNILRLYRELL